MTPTPADERQETASFIREVVMFPCSGVRCQAWLYLPTSSSNGALPPVVVAAHGLGATADHHSGFVGAPLPSHCRCMSSAWRLLCCIAVCCIPPVGWL